MPQPQESPAEREPKPPFKKQQIDMPGLESHLRPKPRYLAENYRAAGKLEGKRAVITGGDSGIGRAVAVLFAKEGADVLITYLPEEEPDARETCAVVENEARQCIAIAGDVTEPGFCREVVQRCVDEWGGVDILVNNAAFQKHVEDVEKLSLEQWDHTFKTNIYGYFLLAQAAIPHMKPGSAIINTGSITGLEGSSGLLDYSSTKGAIHAFTKSLAQMLVERGIRVNCVAPGPVWTPLNPAEAEEGSERIEHFGEDVPYGRPAQPEEIAPSYVFLASNADSSYITGEVLTVLGGETIA